MVETRPHKILIFDVETNGLLPKNNKQGPPLSIENYPYILQLSYAMYDSEKKEIIQTYDTYINVPETVNISNEISNLTGITREICTQKGKNIVDVLEKFYEAYMFCDALVAHNMDFDEKMISIEMERNKNEITEKTPHNFMIFNSMYEKIHGIERYCTMRKGTNICNIMFESKIPGGTGRKKWPRLNELHEKLFPGEIVNGLHNSMVDVLVCLKCYLKMRFDTIDESITKML